MEEFDIPDHLIKARTLRADGLARGKSVDMPIEGTFVGMVDRDELTPG